jgi:hypothetical protein
MKKSRIFMAVGALALVVAGAMASKATKKFNPFPGPFYTTGGIEVLSGASCFAIPGISVNDFTLTGTGTHLNVSGVTLYGYSGSTLVPVRY